MSIHLRQGLRTRCGLEARKTIDWTEMPDAMVDDYYGSGDVVDLLPNTDRVDEVTCVACRRPRRAVDGTYRDINGSLCDQDGILPAWWLP